MVPAPSEIFQVTRKVAGAFEATGIRYFLGGSVASALYGEARSTRDIDFVAAMLPLHVDPFVAALGHEFYALDRAYLDEWARELGLADLLRRAVDEAGLPLSGGGTRS